MQVTSPLPQAKHQAEKPTTVDFPAAIRWIMDGKRVTRPEWNEPDTYGVLGGGFLSLHKAGEATNVLHAWLVNEGDLLGTDWVVLP